MIMAGARRRRMQRMIAARQRNMQNSDGVTVTQTTYSTVPSNNGLQPPAMGQQAQQPAGYNAPVYGQPVPNQMYANPYPNNQQFQQPVMYNNNQMMGGAPQVQPTGMNPYPGNPVAAPMPNPDNMAPVSAGPMNTSSDALDKGVDSAPLTTPQE